MGMLCKLKTSLVIAALVTLFACVLTTPLAVGQAGAKPNPAAAKPPADKAAADKAAADKAAADKAAAEAKKIADLKADVENHPMVVIGVQPYVAEENKGILGTLAKPTIPGTPATSTQPAIPETPATPASVGTPGKAGMGDRIAVVFDDRFPDVVKYKLKDPTKLVLFVDGRVFKDVHPESVGWNRVVFKLERTTPAIDAWNSLLGSPGVDPIKPVKVSVGYADEQPWNLAFDEPNLKLIVYRRGWAIGSLVALIVMFGLFLKYGRTTLLRDAGPPNPPQGKDRPYSLAKVQVAWWFFLVVGCFLLIYLITGEFTMTEQALTLIGIGTGTALGSAMIDSSKRSASDSELGTLNPQKAKLETEIAELLKEKVGLETAVSTNPGATDTQKASLQTDQESLKAKNIELAGKQEDLRTVSASIEEATSGLTKPTSEGWWSDLVTDANGPSFHRFQMIAWTVVLGVLFLASVYKSLSMPEFSGTMLALMGISAGTYLGFKIPEKQNMPEASVAGAGANASVASSAVLPGVVADEAETIDGCDVDIIDETPDEDLPITEGGVN
jgi:hypothetical protein